MKLHIKNPQDKPVYVQLYEVKPLGFELWPEENQQEWIKKSEAKYPCMPVDPYFEGDIEVKREEKRYET